MTLEENIFHYVNIFTTPSGDPPTAPFHEVNEETGILKEWIRH